MAQPRASISHVSDTAHWVAYYRALESERPDALFHDRHARQLAGPSGEAIARGMQGGLAGGWPLVVRTKLMDEIIEGFAARGEIDTVLNLAAGLDARPYRLKLPRELRWVEVDLPEMITFKRSVLRKEAPVCALESVELDLIDVTSRRALFARVGAPGRHVLVISEGLLIYLSPEAVGGLADDLARAPGIRRWLIDLASPALLKMMSRTWGKRVSEGGAPFLFAPEEGVNFFARHGFREEAFFSIWEGALRFNRKPPMAWLWRMAGFFSPPKRKEEIKRFSGVVLLRRA
jgi:methyltransferase (TIGR00027 family)